MWWKSKPGLVAPDIQPVFLEFAFATPALQHLLPSQNCYAIAPSVNAALRLAYHSYASVAVLIPQRVIGIKSFQEQASQ